MFKSVPLLALAAALLASCADDTSDTSQSSGGAERQVGVIAEEIVMEREAERIESVGTARALARATIYPESAGEVERLGFSAGERVEAGDVLVQLEADDERLAVRLAEVAVREAEQLLARYRRIENTGAVSDSQIDEAETALAAAEIELQQARVALRRRTVRAPFTGFVGLTDIDAGARIGPDTVITELDDRTTLYVDFSLPEQVFGRLTVGDVVEAVPFAGAGGAYGARVINVDSRIDPAARTFIVRAEIDNAADELRPGMSFRVGFELLSDIRPVAPESAVSWGSDGAYIWVVREGAAVRVPVTLVQRRQGRVLVSAPLESGELVVAEGIQRLRDGAPVDIIEVRRPGVRNGVSAGTPAASGDGSGR